MSRQQMLFVATFLLAGVFSNFGDVSGSNGNVGSCGIDEKRNRDLISWANNHPVMIKQDLKGKKPMTLIKFTTD